MVTSPAMASLRMKTPSAVPHGQLVQKIGPQALRPSPAQSRGGGAIDFVHPQTRPADDGFRIPLRAPQEEALGRVYGTS